jgi:hypothetical protein
VAQIERHEPESGFGAARFQRDRGFGFQPNVKRPTPYDFATLIDAEFVFN